MDERPPLGYMQSRVSKFLRVLQADRGTRHAGGRQNHRQALRRSLRVRGCNSRTWHNNYQGAGLDAPGHRTGARAGCICIRVDLLRMGGGMTGTHLLRSLRATCVRRKPSTGAAPNTRNTRNDLFQSVERKRGIAPMPPPCRAPAMCKKIVLTVHTVLSRASAGFPANARQTKRTQGAR